MDILNYLRQTFFGEPKLVGEGETETPAVETRTSRYNSILFEHVERHPIDYSDELVSAMVAAEGKDDDCDLCSMFGVDECYLHRTTGLYGMEMAFRDLVTNVDRKSSVTLHHEGLAFKAVFSDNSNRWVLFIKGVSEIDD